MTCRCIPGPLGDPCHRCGRTVACDTSTEDVDRERYGILLNAVFAVQDGMDIRTVRRRSADALGREREPRA